jgi:hypothetical protein
MSDIGVDVSTPEIKRRGKDRPRRSARPERITIGGVEFARNDVIATDYTVTERTVNRGDARGAPYTYIGGVKYRPVEGYAKFLLSEVKHGNQPPKSRRRRAR